MSIRVMSDVWDFGPEDSTERYVLLALSDHCNDEGRSCYPAISKLVDKTRFSERTVVRTIASLESGGWISVVRGGNGRGIASQYVVNISRLRHNKGCQPVTLEENKGCQPVKERVPMTTVKGANLSEKGANDDSLYRLTVINHQLNQNTQPSKKLVRVNIPEECFKNYPKNSLRSAGINALTNAIQEIANLRFGGSFELAGKWMLGQIILYANSKYVKTIQPRYLPSAKSWAGDRQYDDDPAVWEIPCSNPACVVANFSDERSQLLRIG